jgi:hypothetical protein
MESHVGSELPERLGAPGAPCQGRRRTPYASSCFSASGR